MTLIIQKDPPQGVSYVKKKKLWGRGSDNRDRRTGQIPIRKILVEDQAV